MQNVDRENPSVTAALRAIAVADANLGASPGVEARLLAELRELHQRNRARTPVAFHALAASLFLALIVPLGYMARHASGPGPTRRRRSSRANADAEVATSFYPLTYSNLPMSSGQIVRVRVSGGSLVSLGYAAGRFDRVAIGSHRCRPADWRGWSRRGRFAWFRS